MPDYCMKIQGNLGKHLYWICRPLQDATPLSDEIAKCALVESSALTEKANKQVNATDKSHPFPTCLSCSSRHLSLF